MCPSPNNGTSQSVQLIVVVIVAPNDGEPPELLKYSVDKWLLLKLTEQSQEPQDPPDE